MTSREGMRALYAKRRANRVCLRCAEPLEAGRKAATCEPCNRKTSELAAKRKAELAAIEADEIGGIPVCRLPVNAKACKSCPICGWRPIVTIASYCGDRLPSCEVCARDEEPTGYPSEMSIPFRAVLLARTCPGLTAREISDEMRIIDDADRNAVASALRRAVQEGLLRTVYADVHGSRIFYPTKKQWIKRAYVRRAA